MCDVVDLIRGDAQTPVMLRGRRSVLKAQGEEFTIDEALAEPMLAIYPFRWDRDGWRIDPRRPVRERRRTGALGLHGGPQ